MIILVTGASSGIGHSIALVLCAQGHSVYGTSRFIQDDTVIQGVRFIQMDVRNEDEVKLGIQRVIQRSGRLDVVINNAGLGMVGAVESTSDGEAKEIFETNVFGVLNVCRHAVPHLREGGGGYIINVASLAARMSLPFRGIYCATKCAVEGFSASLSMEVKQFNIKVVIIEPGDFNTNINRNRKAPQLNNADIYGDQQDRVLNQVSNEVQKALQPAAIGHLVASIILNPKPKLRYRSHKLLHQFALLMRWILPSRRFENWMMRYYRIPRKGIKKNPMY